MYVGTDPLLFNNAGVPATLFNDSGDTVTYDLDRIAGNELGTLTAGQSASVTTPVWVRSQGQSQVHIETSASVVGSASQTTTCIVKRPEDFGAERDGTTDDTAAITSAINAAVAAAIADGSFYCEVQFSSGVYKVSSPTTKGGATKGNAQIPLPVVLPAGGGQKVTLVLKGTRDAGAWVHWNQTVGQKSGAVIKTTLSGQTPDGTWGSPSVIGGPTTQVDASNEFSNMRLVLDGITISTPLNPSVIACDARRLAQCDVVTFAALADGKASDLNGSATDSNGIGIYLPRLNNNDSCNVGVLSVEGFYYGIGFSDHLVADRLGLIYCNTAMFASVNSGANQHGASVQYISAEAIGTVLEVNGGGGGFPVAFEQVNVETLTGTAFKDTSNSLRGYINYAAVDGSDPTVSGCAGVKITNLHRKPGALAAPALPATGVASTPVARDAAVTISGGTVSAVAIDGQTLGVTSGTVYVPAGKTIAITYSVAPAWKWTLL